MSGRRTRSAALLLLTVAAAAPLPAQTAAGPARVVPLEEPEGFRLAVERGTRTRTGAPGPRYWQQRATYQLEAEIIPNAKRLVGRGTATYTNQSPGPLSEVYVHAYSNLFERDAKRNTDTPMLGGIRFTKVAVEGVTLDSVKDERATGYRVDGTVMRIRLPRPLASGATMRFEFAWNLRVQPDNAPRGGQDGEVWYLSYWYPQFAVYDDVTGWQVDPYLGNAEFYMGYADYDVALTVPAGWLVQATGTLENAEAVLQPDVRERLALARTVDTVVAVVGEAQVGQATLAGTDGKLTWRFRTSDMRDVAWATSARYRWDAVRVPLAGDTGLAHAFWRPGQERNHWDKAARYARHAVQYFSRLLWPYPYPHMTAADGPQGCGGMEYPMMTCIGGTWDSTSMYEVLAHEIGHMWFPMMVGSDEKRFAWMDEGLTQYHQSQAMPDIFAGFDDEKRNRDGYLNFLRVQKEAELMRGGDRYPGYGQYAIASYYKPASVLVALRATLGRETFERAMREYGARWRGRHPQPQDFFHTMEDVSGRDLSWFWQEWFYETWTLDQAIDSVSRDGDSLVVTVANRGRAIMPAFVDITREDGTTERLTIPAEAWLADRKKLVTVKAAALPAPRRVVLDGPSELPDVERGNQEWPR